MKPSTPDSSRPDRLANQLDWPASSLRALWRACQRRRRARRQQQERQRLRREFWGYE